MLTWICNQCNQCNQIPNYPYARGVYFHFLPYIHSLYIHVKVRLQRLLFVFAVCIPVISTVTALPKFQKYWLHPGFAWLHPSEFDFLLDRLESLRRIVRLIQENHAPAGAPVDPAQLVRPLMVPVGLTETVPLQPSGKCCRVESILGAGLVEHAADDADGVTVDTPETFLHEGIVF